MSRRRLVITAVLAGQSQSEVARTLHLHHHAVVVSRATIHRTLARHGTLTPDRKKRPKSSYIRFQAEKSRYALHISAHTRITSQIVWDTFTKPQVSTAVPRRH